MAQTRIQKAATKLSVGSRKLLEVARRMRALEALGSSLSPEARSKAFNEVSGEIRAFRATTLQNVLDDILREAVIGVVNPEADSLIQLESGEQ